MVSAAQWHALERWFARAQDASAAERLRLVAAATAEAPGLGAQLERLLAATEARDAAWVQAAAGPLPIGTVVDGAFTIRQVLGRGGMGWVYLAHARRPGLPEHVAIKVCMVRGRGAADRSARFARESRALAACAHPGVVRWWSAGQFGPGAFYFAMEWVEGGVPLDAHARSLPLRRRLLLLAAVADAVEHCHDRGVVHRDLKPANVLVTREGVPKLIDFGIARLLCGGGPRATRVGQLLGTPAYASPRLLSGFAGAATPCDDVWSLGVMLSELLFGVSPLRRAQRRAVQRGRPVGLGRAPRRLGAEVDRHALKRVLGSCLAFDPDVRMASAAALAADLRHLAGRQPVLAQHPPIRRRLRWWLRRHGPAAAWATAFAGRRAGGAGVVEGR